MSITLKEIQFEISGRDFTHRKQLTDILNMLVPSNYFMKHFGNT